MWLFSNYIGSTINSADVAVSTVRKVFITVPTCKLLLLTQLDGAHHARDRNVNNKSKLGRQQTTIILNHLGLPSQQSHLRISKSSDMGKPATAY